MPKGIYIHRKPCSLVFREAQRARVLGRKHTEAAKQLMREKRIAYLTPEHRAAISRRMKGHSNLPYGYLHSEETKSKIRQSTKGKSNPYKGIPLSAEHKRKISETKKEKDYTLEYRQAIKLRMQGSNNPNWNGGTGNLPYPYQFTRELKHIIKQRDNYTCQLCNDTENGRKHHIHHINYIKEDIRPENLIELCQPCHSKTNSHHCYWQAYFDKVFIVNTGRYRGKYKEG